MAKKRHGPKPVSALPPARFEVGEEVRANYRPLRCDILTPTKVLAIEPGNSVSGWLVTVMTNVGPRSFDMYHFAPL